MEVKTYKKTPYFRPGHLNVIYFTSNYSLLVTVQCLFYYADKAPDSSRGMDRLSQTKAKKPRTPVRGDSLSADEGIIISHG